MLEKATRTKEEEIEATVEAAQRVLGLGEEKSGELKWAIKKSRAWGRWDWADDRITFVVGERGKPGEAWMTVFSSSDPEKSRLVILSERGERSLSEVVVSGVWEIGRIGVGCDELFLTGKVAKDKEGPKLDLIAGVKKNGEINLKLS